jgi:hypothetical protein
MAGLDADPAEVGTYRRGRQPPATRVVGDR